MSPPLESHGRLGAARFWLLLASLVAVHLTVGSSYLSNAPRFFSDESFEASLGYKLADEGHLGTAAMVGVGGMETWFVQNRIVLSLGCAATYFAIGDRGPVTCRVTALAFGTVALTSTALLARHFFGAGPALLAGLALLLHPWFLEVTRRIRPEICYGALGMLGAWLLASAVEAGSRRRTVLAGLCLGLCALAHPVGVLFAAAVSAAALATLGPRRVLGSVPLLAVGGALVLVPFVVYVMLASQNPDVFFLKQMTAGRPQIIRWELASTLR